MRALEVGYELTDDLTLAAHGPELDDGWVARSLLAPSNDQSDHKCQDDAHYNPIKTLAV